MAINPADAVAAYKANIKTAPSSMMPGNEALKPSNHFMEMVKDVASNAIEANKQAEEISKQGLTGKAELSDVVAAVSHAETALQSVVTVRDKVIYAYQEILRMPI